ncbi:MAG: hypothetical protein IJI68_12160 [Eggerthellaceae bacterium]|nr:hypothetical protein [Eggerthellaceae bacterium]
MSITDELRDCIRTADRSYEDARNPYNDREILYIPDEELLAIADRIDERHRMALEKVAAMVDAPPKLDELDRAVAILEQHDIEDALRISELFVRVEQMERKLNHKGGAE